MRQRTLRPRAATHVINASTLEYGRYMARPGDYVRFREALTDIGSVVSGSVVTFGRVLGQIKSTENDGLKDCAGWLAVAVVADNLTFGYERWVDPAWVIECQPATQVEDFLRAFLASDNAQIERSLVANSGILSAAKTGKLWDGNENV